MQIAARAPGKLVALGEYAVLAGGPALVMAVDRHCEVELAPSADDECHLSTIAGNATRRDFAPSERSGVGIVEAVLERWPASGAAPWQARLDSSALFDGPRKLGLGSSAAALVAWAGAWLAYTRGDEPVHARASLAEIVELHRSLQGGAGSGLDVAASLLGGVLAFRSATVNGPDAVSVRLPDGVRFIGVSTSRAASTGDLIARFEAWRTDEPGVAAMQLNRMREIAERGVASARNANAAQFMAAVRRYGEALEALGAAMGAEIVTSDHAALAEAAARHRVAYKVSGAGGGDVGLAFASDPGALEAFAAAMPPGCDVLRLEIDGVGLATEERAA